MRLFTIPSWSIDAFGSSGVLMDFLPPVTAAATTSVNVAHLEPGGTLGRHDAVLRQVFAVVAGTGEVQVDDEPRVPVEAGTLVVWEPGETHQTWAATALTAVVVETEGALTLDEHFTERSTDP